MGVRIGEGAKQKRNCSERCDSFFTETAGVEPVSPGELTHFRVC